VQKISAICWRNLLKQILNELQSQIQHIRRRLANSILTQTRPQVFESVDRCPPRRVSSACGRRSRWIHGCAFASF
jgi:hypothetical protein